MGYESPLGSVMHAVDTNVLVRLIARDDAEQIAWAEEFVCGGAWVSHLVLVETMWVLDSVYELGHSKKRPKLGFSDCMVLEIARKAGHVPLGTFDRALGKSDGAVAL
jgi:predicted nucleic-acid-binding protein